MSKTRHVIFTVLILGNIPVFLQAEPVEMRIETVASDASEKRGAATRIRELLEQQGLDAKTAEQKVAGLFVRPTTHQELQILSERLGGTPNLAQIETALTKRALFGRSIDLRSADHLIGLFQSATGRVPDTAQLAMLHAAAAS